MTITITAGKAGLDFQALVADFDKNFDRGDSRGVFNDTLFTGSEYVLSEDPDLGGKTADQGFIANGKLNYDFPTHTIRGTISSLEFGHGAKEQGSGFGFAKGDVVISGLNVKDAKADELLGTLMEADVSVLAKILAADSIKFVGSAAADSFTGFGKADTISGGGGNDKLSGGGGNDKLKGDSGNDTLIGGSGNDTLNGGTGKDTLTGGSGKDTFVFTSALGSANRDRITDFSVKDDTIELSHTIFKGLKEGDLASSAFKAAAHATDASDRIVYDPKTGYLYFDPDGNGAKAASHFATLAAGLKMTASDFDVI